MKTEITEIHKSLEDLRQEENKIENRLTEIKNERKSLQFDLKEYQSRCVHSFSPNFCSECGAHRPNFKL